MWSQRITGSRRLPGSALGRVHKGSPLAIVSPAVLRTWTVAHCFLPQATGINFNNSPAECTQGATIHVIVALPPSTGHHRTPRCTPRQPRPVSFAARGVAARGRMPGGARPPDAARCNVSGGGPRSTPHQPRPVTLQCGVWRLVTARFGHIRGWHGADLPHVVLSGGCGLADHQHSRACARPVVHPL